MDEELMDIVTEDNIEVKQEEGIDTNVTIEDEEYDVPVSDDIETVEAEMPETIEIEIEESIGWVGGDSTRHYSLYGRDEPDQHPITAITGLREELDNIEALDVVYSDKRNQADYYLWKDGNPRQEDRVGYFVRACSNINEVEICATSHDIFGVTVDDAGFVGGQDDIPRDTKYCLVVTNGIVHVRCESAVAVGDYVIANAYGYATRNQNGYKVAGRHRINGVDYAEITLVTPIGRICDLTNDVENLNTRMDDAEQNIVAAINVANEAYKKAGEAGSVSEDAIKNALDALEKADGAVGKTDDFEGRLSDANAMAVQAKAWAESAATSAESMRNEAVDAANNALVETYQLRGELEATASKMKKDIDDTIADINDLTKDLEPLATWPNAENPTGVAGFVAKANEDSATLASVTKFEGEFGKAITGFVQEATKENATVKAIADYKQRDENGNVIADGAAALIGQVEANKSSIDILTNLEGEGFSGLAGLTAQVNANSSSITTLASHVVGDFENTDDWIEDGKDINKVYYDKNSRLYYYYDKETSTWKSTPNSYEAGLTGAMASVQAKADNNSSSIEDLTTWYGDINDSIARVEQRADENGASINSIVSSVDKYSVGEYSQSYGLTYEQAKNILREGMVYIPVNNPNGKTHSEGSDLQEEFKSKGQVGRFKSGDRTYVIKVKSLSLDGYWGYIFDDDSMITRSSIDTTEVIVSDGVPYYTPKPIKEFTEGCYYKWVDEQKDPFSAAGWEEHKDEVIMGGNCPANSSGQYKYWYINSDTAEDGYEPHALYIWEAPKDGESYWKKVNTLSGNVNNRVTNMIRQTADEISLEIANARGSSATLGARITETESVVENTAQWAKGFSEDGIPLYNIATMKASADGDGSSLALVVADTEGNKILKGASIVLGQDEKDSFIHLDADNIQLEGYITANKTFSIDLDGSMKATGGTIGEWQIGESFIGKTTTEYNGIPGVFLFSPQKWTADSTSSASDVLVIRNLTITDAAGNYSSDPSFPFVLKADGSLYATKANITGTITATGGNIGNWLLTEGRLQTGDFSNASTLCFISTGTSAWGGPGMKDWLLYLTNKFGVDTSGNMYAFGGEIAGWDFDSYTLSGGSNETGSSYFYLCANPSGDDSYMAAKDPDDNWCFYVDKTGHLHATGATISGHIEATSGSFSGTLNAGTLLASNNLKVDTWGNGNGRIVTKDEKVGITFDYTYNNILVFANNEINIGASGSYGNIRITPSTAKLQGTWEVETGVGIWSDSNLKNSIESLPTEYEDVIDYLRPVRYKYNHGTSDRYHTGFIAQDVGEALKTANIDSKDFAGLVIFNQGEEDERWTLRYEEFISLNTAAIQKLKSRVAELEAKVEALVKE